MDYNFFPNI